MRKIRTHLATGLLALLLCSVAGLVCGQDNPETSVNQPVSLGLLTGFLDRYGHTTHETAEDEDRRLIRFSVTDSGQQKTIDFVILYLPKREAIKIECPHLADIPTPQDQRDDLLQSLMALNGVRTIGKYCFDREGVRVRYFCYRTVAGGLCYADFSKTLSMIEYMVFNDLKTVRNE